AGDPAVGTDRGGARPADGAAHGGVADPVVRAARRCGAVSVRAGACGGVVTARAGPWGGRRGRGGRVTACGTGPGTHAGGGAGRSLTSWAQTGPPRVPSGFRAGEKRCAMPCGTGVDQRLLPSALRRSLYARIRAG